MFVETDSMRIIPVVSHHDIHSMYVSMDKLIPHSSVFIQAVKCTVISGCGPPHPSHPGWGSWERGPEADPRVFTNNSVPPPPKAKL